MVEAITQENIYQPVADDLQAVLAEIATIADRAPENAPEQAYDLDAQLGHVLATSGKRVRPALTLIASRLFGQGEGEMPVKMATAVELLHIATLVHDDTVDHADTRRGHQTASKLWGRNVAVLIGDFVFATSAMYVCDTNNVRLVRRFAETITELARGELNEIYTAWQPNVAIEEYNQRIYDKTASLFCTAAEGGAVLGGGNNDQTENVRNYGYNIGMAYQVYDDLLDYRSTSEQLGKPAGHDLGEGILTLPAILAAENGASEDILALMKAPEEARADLLPIAVDAIKESGALELSHKVANDYINSAVRSLDGIPPSDSLDSLLSLAEYVQARNH
ncbi:MAG: polyprenyl synthetase family protein [Dehalococcoidia bacterium]|jgi:geranylgeranyl pyrophosphate synthase|nr:heptaprenyl diphosphate synthase [Chloroflexota bacterium]MDP6055903.1 polyprenyl synthetase family protein [Dehalococcoidia bacterium]MDP7089719.1 polyprenyl synthetase family protein [Dehalococcoidia bacterium]MDP7261899.1 polyprenyl synthetase family protein [Dehalococcoidia bacterium]MDP7485839.1 polyprenyl synthetase family protein [Dehalococcoidia bacterium]|tara:strand:- start:839 stop:1843 length:1005 start_codon:yes stop_codon:yes gene_type:complete